MNQLLPARVRNELEQLLAWNAANGRLAWILEEALGVQAQTSLALRSAWQKGNFDSKPFALPKIRIVKKGLPSTVKAAYLAERGVILLNHEWFRSADDESRLTTLIHEVGHHLDSLFNPSDSTGDEGRHFADYLLGSKTESLQYADDTVVINYRGKQYFAEADSVQAGTVGSSREATTVTGTSGNDTLDGGTGRYIDTLDGKEGDDTYIVDTWLLTSDNTRYWYSDTIIDSGGKDIVRLRTLGGDGTEVTSGQFRYRVPVSIEQFSFNNNTKGRDLRVTSESGASHTIIGTAGDDVFRTSRTKLTTTETNLDTLRGGGQADEYQFMSNALHSIDDSAGARDTIFFLMDLGGSSYTNRWSSIEQLRLDPDATIAQNLTGIGHKEIIVGSKGNNSLVGGGESDTIYGGAGGSDTLTSGTGSDTIVAINSGEAEPVNPANTAIIQSLSVQQTSTGVVVIDPGGVGGTTSNPIWVYDAAPPATDDITDFTGLSDKIALNNGTRGFNFDLNDNGVIESGEKITAASLKVHILDYSVSVSLSDGKYYSRPDYGSIPSKTNVLYDKYTGDIRYYEFGSSYNTSSNPGFWLFDLRNSFPTTLSTSDFIIANYQTNDLNPFRRPANMSLSESIFQLPII